MNRRRRAIHRIPVAVGLTVALVTGCDEGPPTAPVPPRGDEPIQTDRQRYEATDGVSSISGQVEFTVVATFTNPTDRTVYLGRCFPDSEGPIYGVEALDTSDSWGAAYDPVWGCVGHDRQFAVEPGATRVDTLRLRGPNAWDGLTGEPFGVLEGFFRIVYDIRFCPDECPDELPRELRVSNAFEVRLER